MEMQRLIGGGVYKPRKSLTQILSINSWPYEMKHGVCMSPFNTPASSIPV